MWLKWFLLVFMLLLGGSVTAASVPTLSNVITLLRLEHDVVADLERGKIVTFAVQESTRKELAIGLATYLPSSPTKLANFLSKVILLGLIRMFWRLVRYFLTLVSILSGIFPLCPSKVTKSRIYWL